MFRTIYLISLVLLVSCQQKQKVDLIITNAKIYSVDKNFGMFEAMAIDKGKIIGMGSDKEILKAYKADATKSLGQKSLYPGFYDAHCHFFGYAELLSDADLKGSKSFDEVIERCIEHRKNYPDSPWLLGRGWDQNLWEDKTFPTKEKLDSIFPDVPVLLTRVDGHAALANQKALDIAGFDADTKIEGGKILLVQGQPTGILMDKAEEEMDDFEPEQALPTRIRSILESQKRCLSVGLTSLVDCGVDLDEVHLSDSLHKSGDLKIKLNLMLNPEQENFRFAKEHGPLKNERLQVTGFKVYSDGALGSRGACLLKPYADDPDNTGFLLSSYDKLHGYAVKIRRLGFQMNTHAIGDSANRVMLDIYNEVLKDDTESRWRIEHAQVVNPEDHSKFAKNKIIPSVQATHCTSDMFWADERLGEDRIHYAYAYKSLLDEAGILAMGSDFPVEDINPLYGFHAAIARVDSENMPEGGFQMEEAISRETALKAMTIWAAYSVFEEERKGSLEVGKDADFVVLEKDIMECDLEEIRNVKVEETYISGEKVYAK